ncbi:MAG TPA: transposase [Methanothrix sp.]|nr:transposase [Methanothrix sp.]
MKLNKTKIRWIIRQNRKGVATKDIVRKGDQIREALAIRLMAIVISVPGIGFISAAMILAEIADYNDFGKAEQLAAWCGLLPPGYQSAVDFGAVVDIYWPSLSNSNTL